MNLLAKGAANRHHIVAASLVLAMGCSNTAIVHRRSGTPITAKIDRSDDEALYVSTPPGSSYRIERRDVSDIDHPGNVVATIGLSLLAASIGLWSLTGQSDNYNNNENGSGFVALPKIFALECLVIGLPMSIFGGAVYVRSVGATTPFHQNANQPGPRFPRP